MKTFFEKSGLICLLFLTISINTKILSSSKLHRKSMSFEAKKDKVNNIMLRALSGVLAKKALKNVLSKNGKAKLAMKEAPERELKQDSFYSNSNTKHKNVKDLRALNLLRKKHQ